MRTLLVLALVICAASCGGSSTPTKGCAVDRECALHQYCDYTTSACTNGCVTASDCQSPLECSDHGRCLPAGEINDAGEGEFDMVPPFVADMSATPHDMSLMPPDLASSSRDLSGSTPPDLNTPPPPDLSPPPSDLSICAADPSEPDNTAFFASPESESDSGTPHQICPSGDVDMFLVTTSHAGMLTATVVRASGPNVDVVLLASDGMTQVADFVRTTDGGSTATVTATASTRYFVQVTGDTSGIVSYTLSTQNQ
jgi:hypothetical protein